MTCRSLCRILASLAVLGVPHAAVSVLPDGTKEGVADDSTKKMPALAKGWGRRFPRRWRPPLIVESPPGGKPSR